jgi:hypothetical protein
MWRSPNINQSEIVVIFKDKNSNNYLYAENNPLYNKDSLKVLDPSGNSLIILKSLDNISSSSLKYWRLSFGNIYIQPTDSNSFNAEICKNYLIKYIYNESDTVQVCFRSRKTECGSVFETLKVYQKGQLIASVNNNTFAEVTIIKN